MPDDRPHELLLLELRRINTELALQRRECAMTAHDLASPAQVILGLSEILLEHQNLDPLVRRRVEQVHRSAVTMSTLISDLSSGLALDDRANLETRRLSFGELLSSVVDRTRLLAEAKDMDVLFIRQAGGRGCWVDGDAVKLERALANLLGNAIKFSPPRSMVSVTLDWGTTHARIAVQDQGPGISNEGHARIFEVFHRRPTAPTFRVWASASTSPSRSSRATEARSAWSPNPVMARPSRSSCRSPSTCRSPASADGPASPAGLTGRTRTCYSSGMILDRFRVDDKVAVVTGAGRGIGAASAVALAEAGADVLLSARTADQLDDVARAVKAAGRRAYVVPADLMDLEAVADLADQAFEEFGRLDIVVNNVGGTIPNALLDTDAAYLEEAFHFNVSTAHALTRSAVPQMLKNDGGSVVNISSVVGRVAGRGYLAYGTAKAALAHYTRLAAQDLSPTIRVNAIAVGSVMTSALEFVASDEATMNEMTTKTPLGRVGEVEDISAAVLYLSSPAGGFVTGKVLEVDGGLQIPNLDLRLPDLEAGAES